MSVADIVGTAALAGGAIGVIGWRIYRGLRLYRARQQRFARRSVLTPEQWFDEFFPEITDSRPLLREVLELLGREIGTEWTRFRPEDTFSQTFSFHEKSWLGWDELDGFWDLLYEWQKKHGIWDTDGGSWRLDKLGDYVRYLDRLIIEQGNQPHHR